MNQTDSASAASTGNGACERAISVQRIKSKIDQAFHRHSGIQGLQCSLRDMYAEAAVDAGLSEAQVNHDIDSAFSGSTFRLSAEATEHLLPAIRRKQEVATVKDGLLYIALQAGMLLAMFLILMTRKDLRIDFANWANARRSGFEGFAKSHLADFHSRLKGWLRQS